MIFILILQYPVWIKDHFCLNIAQYSLKLDRSLIMDMVTYQGVTENETSTEEADLEAVIFTLLRTITVKSLVRRMARTQREVVTVSLFSSKFSWMYNAMFKLILLYMH